MPAIGQCCATGSLHAGTPKGELTTLHGLETYVANPPAGTAPKGIVVIIPDAFGIGLPNNRILADAYAEKIGAKVLLPDFMGGFVMPPEMMISFKAMSATGLMNQVYKAGHLFYLMRYFMPFIFFCRESVASPRIYSFFKALQENEAKDLPVGTAGFCWGAKYVVELLWDQTKSPSGKRLVDCGFVAHPSNIKYPGDVNMAVLPLSCAAAEHDMMMSAAQAEQTKGILEAKTAKTKNEGVEHEYVWYEGAHHGFAVRADEEDLQEAESGRKAEAQAVNWFGRWFAHPPPTPGN